MGTRSASIVTTSESEKNGLELIVSHIITMIFVWVKIYQILSARDGEYGI
jgi:hypothetical protein